MDRSRNEPPRAGGGRRRPDLVESRPLPAGGISEAPGGPPATRWWRPRRLRSGAPTGAGRGDGAPRPCGGGGDRSGAGGNQPRVDGRPGGSVSRPVESSSGKREAPGGRSAGRQPPLGEAGFRGPVRLRGRRPVPRAARGVREPVRTSASRYPPVGPPANHGTSAPPAEPLVAARILASAGPPARRIGSAWSDGPVRPPTSSNGERNGRPEDPHPGVRRLSTDRGGEGRWGRDGGRPHRAGPVAASTGARGGPGSESRRSAKRGGPGHPGTGPKNSSQWPSGSRVKTRFSRASRIRATMGSLRRRSSASHPSTSETRKPRWSNSVPRRCGS